MTRLIGIALILFGVIFGSYHYIEWQTGRSSAEELTKEELSQYNKEPNQTIYKERKTPDGIQKTTTQKQIPSSSIKHDLGSKIGYLIVPKINHKYSVYWGADDNVLKKGVGMFVSNLTTAPDGAGHTVLSGHRDTVFYKLKELKMNDPLKIKYNNSIYTYKISKIWITDAKDQTVIVKKAHPTLTLTTCYPFNYIGNAPKRYIVQADYVNTQENISSP